MKNCESIRERMLSGEDSGEIRSHLEGCPECALMLSFWESVKSSGKSSLADVPASLDFAVMAKAAEAARRHRNASLLKKFLWIPAAAVLFVSAGVVIFSMSESGDGKISASEKPVAAAVKLMSWDSLDTEILVLSAELESAGSSIDLANPELEASADYLKTAPSAIIDSSHRSKKSITVI